MTEARMEWQKNRLTLDGHAGGGPRGQDIICAAESMLTQALLQTLIDLEEEKKCSVDWIGSAEGGYLQVDAAAAAGYEETIETCFRMTVTGLRMLEERYPEHIKLTEEG